MCMCRSAVKLHATHRLLPVHSPIVEMYGEIIGHKVIEHDDVIAAAAEENTSHAVFKQIVGYNCAAELVIEVYGLKVTANQLACAQHRDLSCSVLNS